MKTNIYIFPQNDFGNIGFPHQMEHPNLTWYDLPDENIEKICEFLSLEDLQNTLSVEKRILFTCIKLYQQKIEERKLQIKKRKQDDIYGSFDYQDNFYILDKRSEYNFPILSWKYSYLEIAEMMWHIGMPLPQGIPTYDLPDLFNMKRYIRGIDTKTFSNEKVEYLWRINTVSNLNLCELIKCELIRTGHIMDL